MLFKIALQSATGKAQEKQQGLKLNGTHQFLAYAKDVHLLSGNIIP
jgi:hypothetical protein